MALRSTPGIAEAVCYRADHNGETELATLTSQAITTVEPLLAAVSTLSWNSRAVEYLAGVTEYPTISHVISGRRCWGRIRRRLSSLRRLSGRFRRWVGIVDFSLLEVVSVASPAFAVGALRPSSGLPGRRRRALDGRPGGAGPFVAEHHQLEALRSLGAKAEYDERRTRRTTA